MPSIAQYKISKSEFFIILVVILLIPIFAKSKLIVFGKRTYGEVLHHEKVYTKGSISSPYYYSIIRFSALVDTTVEMRGAQNIIYEVGEKVKIAYDKKNPLNCMILAISYIYSGFVTSIAGFLVLVWIAVYTSFRKKG